MHRPRSVGVALALVTSLVTAVEVAPAAAATIPSDVWVTDGEVNAVAVGQGRVFLGGDFTQVGPPTGGGALIDDATGLRELPFDRIDGDVRVVVPDGSGGWFVGGDFQFVDDKSRPRVAHITAAGSVTSWRPVVTGPVEAMVLDGTTLYIGGSFDTVASTARAGLAALDVSSNAVNLLAWDPGADGAVLAMALNHAGDGILVGGEFLNTGGSARTRMAEIASATGVATTFAPAANGSVRTIVASGDGATIYAGGDFTSFAGSGRSRLATVDSTGSLLGWNPGANGSVHEMVEAADQGSVYVAGSFTTAAGAGRANLAEITTGGSATSFAPDADATVYGLALTAGDSSLVVAGAFTQVGGVARNRLAELSPSTSAATGWDPNANGEAWTVAVGSGAVFAGGAFGSINGVARANLAALDAASGELDLSWQADTNNEVLALDIGFNDRTLYVGGRFTKIDGIARSKIAAVKAKNGVVRTSFKANASGNVWAVHVTQETVYIGGDFTSVASTRRTRIAALDPSFGSLDLGFQASVDGRVRSIATSGDGNVVYLGGDFSSVDGVPRSNLTALHAGSGDLFGTFSGVTGRKVYDLATDGDRLYAAMGGAGGRFSAMDLVTGTEDYAITLDGDAQALTPMGSYIYVGGHFDNADGQKRTRLMAVDRASGALSNDWVPSTDGELSVFSMVDIGGSIWLGGDFHLVRSRSSQHVAKLGGIVEADGLYGSTIQLDGAGAHWRLGEQLGSTAAEEIDNQDGAYEGTPGLGRPGLITGPNGAVDFSGNDAVGLPDDGAINLGGPYTDRTIELWFVADTTAGRQVLVETGGKTAGYVLYVEGGAVHGGAWDTASFGAVYVETAVSAGTIYHVALVHDAAGPGELRLYLDGVQRDTAAGAGTVPSHSRDAAIGAMRDESRFDDNTSTGAGANGNGLEFDGRIDEVALYDTQLSVGALGNHHTIGTTAVDIPGGVALGHEETRLASDPLSYWSMGDAGSVVVDWVGASHGTALGGPETVAGTVGAGAATRFDGHDDVVRLADDPRTNTARRTVARTVEVSFAADGRSPGVLYEEGGTTRGLNLYTHRGRLYAGAWDRSARAVAGGADFAVFASAPIPTGEVVHAAAVFDAAAGTVSLYVDGRLASVAVGYDTLRRHAGDRAIGGTMQGTRLETRTVRGTGLYFAGVIEEIIVYGTALSADTIVEHAGTTS